MYGTEINWEHAREFLEQLLIDSAILDEVRGKKRNLTVAFYDYQKAYDMLRHYWIERVYTWMRIPDNVVKVLKVMMERWRTRPEVNDSGIQ